MSSKYNNAYDIVNDTIDSFEEKKGYTKQINGRLRDAFKNSGLEDKALLRRCKDLISSKGKGWDGSNPLSLDPAADKKDKLSQTLIKLVQAVSDLTTIGQEAELTEYIDALNSIGIKLDISGFSPAAYATNPDECVDAITYAATLSSDVDAIQDKIKDDAMSAELQGFGPAKIYTKLCQLYQKKKKGKNIDEDYNIANADLLFEQQSYADVYKDTISDKELPNV